MKKSFWLELSKQLKALRKRNICENFLWNSNLQSFSSHLQLKIKNFKSNIKSNFRWSNNRNFKKFSLSPTQIFLLTNPLSWQENNINLSKIIKGKKTLLNYSQLFLIRIDKTSIFIIRWKYKSNSWRSWCF